MPPVARASIGLPPLQGGRYALDLPDQLNISTKHLDGRPSHVVRWPRVEIHQVSRCSLKSSAKTTFASSGLKDVLRPARTRSIFRPRWTRSRAKHVPKFWLIFANCSPSARRASGSSFAFTLRLLPGRRDV